MSLAVAPAAERNKQAILEVLRHALPEEGLVLEIASGTGQHASFFALHLPALTWQPTDRSREALRNIEAWVSEAGCPTLRPPLELDVTHRPWPLARAQAVLCINMIHIAPWAATEALFDGARSILRTGEPLITYGPYRVDGEHTAPSNAAFDQSLRSRDPAWGVRDLEDLRTLGTKTGFQLTERITMPANNMTLVWNAVDRA